MELGRQIARARELGAQYADLRISSFNGQGIVVENSTVSSLQDNNAFFYGVRAFVKGAWGLSFGTDIAKLEESIKTAVKLAKLSSSKTKESFRLMEFPIITDKVKTWAKLKPEDIALEEKVKRVLEFDKLLKVKPVVNRTTAVNFSSGFNEFYNTDGSEISEQRIAFRIYSQAVGKEGKNIQNASNRVGMVAGYEEFAGIDPGKFTKEILESLNRLLKAEHAPAGHLPVVIDPILCHVFFHEALGHGCEADAVIEKRSVLADRRGQKLAPEWLTVSDDPGVAGENGNYKYDSEGIPGKEAFLVKEGVLSEFLNSRETASRLGLEPNGHGRAETPMVMAYPRMANTVVYPGKFKFEELLEGIKLGVYAKDSSGGVVEPNNGNFLFNAQEGWLIENGKLTKPLKDVSFGGNILEILPKVERVGDDQIPCRVGGWCGKKGQRVPVCGKAPSIMISEAMIGGKAD
jgi:TldD protein